MEENDPQLIEEQSAEEHTAREKLMQFNCVADTPPVCNHAVQWINRGVKYDPEGAALSFGDQKMTHRTLQKHSNQVARYLRSHGVKEGSRVGLALERSPEMIICLIGILKAGAAYVPLDPSYPEDRLHMMIEDAGLEMLITHQSVAARFNVSSKKIIVWDRCKTEIRQCSSEKPDVVIDESDIAYVIFTSGSTGRPKGIRMPHRALANLIEWQLEQSYFKPRAAVVQYASISFDVSFQEIATTLATGGTLHLIEDTCRRDPRLLLQEIDKKNIERIFVPFVALRSIIEVARATDHIPDSLREVITAGEQLRVDEAVRDFFDHLPHDAILDNQYGPSETHVISSHLLQEDPASWPDLPPIGTPIKNNSIFLLDDDMQPVKTGTAGELYLSGRNVAKGYIGRDEQTKKSFLKNPYAIANRPIMYKTGDLGRYNSDGSINFLGRADNQVKIRGYRIEPGEINSVGANFPGIAHCITRALDKNGTKQLVTYIVSDGQKVDTDAFRAHLESTLPEYMVPAYIMSIEDVPYTPSGKVNLRALPEPGQSSQADHGTAVDYQSKTEATLAAIWQDLLHRKRIAREADFFALGGDSLLAVTLFLRIEEEFGTALPLSTLTQAPTLAALSRCIDKKTIPSTKADDFRSLRTLQEGNSTHPPLFLVHGGDGNVLMFRELAASLDSSIPVFAFQWPGWDGGRGIDGIKGMAAFYVDELQRRIDGSRPFYLGGHCIGGIIVLEMAHILRNKDAPLRSPVLVSDSPNFASRSYRFNEPSISDQEFAAFRAMQHALDKEIPAEVKAMDIERNKLFNPHEEPKNGDSTKRFIEQIPFYHTVKPPIKYALNWLESLLTRGKYITGRAQYRWMLAQSQTVPMQQRKDYSALSQIKAVRTYQNCTYKEDILYLRSTMLRARSLGFHGWWDDLFMGFGEQCAGHFDAHVVGGQHNDIYRNPYAQKLIRQKLFEAPSN